MISAFGIDHGSPISKAANPLAAVGRRVATAQIRSGERTTNRGYRLVEVAAQRASTLPDELNGHDLVRAKRLRRAGERGISAVNRGQKRIANGQRHAASATKTGAVVIAVPVAAGGSYAGYKKVTKSLVPGKGFVKATELTRSERVGVKVGGAYKKAKGVTPEDRKYRDVTRKEMRREVVRDTKKSQMRSNKSARADWGFGRTSSAVAGYAVRQGSKSSGRTTVVLSRRTKTPEQADGTYLHEMAHAKPKRSEYRLHHQIAEDPVKRMREEARADMAAGNYFRNPAKKTDSGYVGGARMYQPAEPSSWHVASFLSGIKPEGLKAFRETQDKIATAPLRRRRSA